MIKGNFANGKFVNAWNSTFKENCPDVGNTKQVDVIKL